MCIMQTPVLSKKQQNSSLSAKKIKSKEIIRNVFTTPYNVQYWPEVSNEDYLILKKTIEDNLPLIRPPKPDVTIPWKELKFVPKEDRSKVRLEFMKKFQKNVPNTVVDNKGLFLGINNVTRHLEKCLLAAVLITNDVQPKLMVQHLIDQSVLNRTPLLIVRDLRTLIQRHCGFPSAVLGISKNLSSSSKLHVIKNCIQDICEHYPVPPNHINYDRSLNFEGDFSETNIKSDKSVSADQKNTKIDVEVLRKQYYLLRETKNNRIFTPQDVTDSLQKMKVDNKFSENVLNEKKVVNYKPLKVKRLKGDVNRKKRILQSLKKKIKLS